MPADNLQVSAHRAARWGRVKALFLDAIDIATADRAAWLDAACAGDTALRAEVDALLASDSAADSRFEIPAAAMPGAGSFAEMARRLAPGLRLGCYEIAAFVGAGGMGEVYRARDARDGREVAIKTVSAALAHPSGELRLLREARHAATLTHPNICAIHEVGEEHGVPFIVMEFVDGLTLSALQREQPVPLGRVLRYGIDVADALEHAHGHGLVHRDLKPSNVMIARDDRAVVLDFGLAKRLPEHEGSQIESLTASGHGPSGTLTHMAPEVLRGGRADARADVWALGVLLYELITGGLPFAGRTPFETSSAILAEGPMPMSRAVPVALRLVVARCLEKDPARRYQRAGDVREALRAIQNRRSGLVAVRLLATSRTAQRRFALTALAIITAALALAFALRPREPAIHAIAVMPLAHGDAPDDAAYAQGVTAAIETHLGAATGLRVVSAASVRNAGTNSVEAGRALGTGAIVTGVLRRTPDTIALDLRLVDTATGATRWSQSFVRSPRDILVLQAEAVRAMAARIDAAMTLAARERLTLVPSIRPDVYEAYLKGRYEWGRRTAGSLLRAVSHFERAIALDPTFAPAYARLADCYNQMGTVLVGSGSPRTYRPLAEAAAIKALQIDPGLADAHAALGYVRHYSWQWTEAEASFLRAIELNPSAPLPRLWYANLLMSRARFDESLRQAHVARDLDPFSLTVHTNIGWIELFAGRVDQSIETLRRAVALDPSYPQAHWRLANALSAAGRFDEALAEANELLRLTGRSPSSVSLLAGILAVTGREPDARRALAELLDRSRREYVTPSIIADTYSFLGDHDSAMQWLERAFQDRANAVAYLAVDPSSRTVRTDPRFQSLLRRVGLADVKAP